MARTWTLVDTNADGSFEVTLKRALVLGGAVYFWAGRKGGYYRIYKWAGGTFTDVSGSTFPESVDGENFFLSDICVFNGQLFCVYGQRDISVSDKIYRYTSGTTWVEDYALVDETAQECLILSQTDWNMDATASYMYVAATRTSLSPDDDRRLFARSTGGSWSTVQMPGSVYTDPVAELVGLSKGSQYGALLTNNRTGSATYKTVASGLPGPFSSLSASDIGDRHLIGYADGFSFYSIEASAGTWEVRRSTNWGVSLSAAGAVANDNDEHLGFGFKDIGSGVVMLCNTRNNQAYTWDPDTDAFVTDGTIDAGSVIYDYFLLGGTLYALAEGSSFGEIEIWEGGPVAGPAFYYGRGNLQYRSALPFPFLNIGGLSIAHPLVFLGSGAAASPMVAYASPSDSYGSWTDFTGVLSDDPINCFDATPWGDAAAASGSGEEDGAGGFLADKC